MDTLFLEDLQKMSEEEKKDAILLNMLESWHKTALLNKLVDIIES